MWARKFPGLSSMISPERMPDEEDAPSVAPVGLGQPAQATHSMERDLMPQSVPNHLPPVPKLNAQPDMKIHAKRRALKNIAMGRKGF